MKKRALLVGINYVGTDHELHGCINDSNNMKALLTGRGFTEIKQILEGDATTAGIVAGLKWLIAGTEPGDVIAFHYSGHGSQMPRASALIISPYLPPSTFEEIICPVDLNWVDKIITDTTLRDIFNQVPNGVNTTVILDCCHSGTMLEQAQHLDTAVKDLAPIVETKSDRFLPPPPGVVGPNLVHAAWSTSKDVNATALLIAGCHSDQTSADTVLNGQPCGAATASLLQAVAANSTISYKQLIIAMCNFMTANKYSQVPELDGDSSLYDQVFLEPFSFTIPASQPVSTTTTTSSKLSNDKVAIIVAVAVIIILFIFFVT